MLSRYDYNPLGGRSGSAGLLQEAIWCLEDETTCGTNGFLAMVSNRFGGLANAKANNNGLYRVGVLNNTNHNGFRQDMLVLRPVPEPGSMLLLGSGLLGYPLLRRKQRKRS